MNSTGADARPRRFTDAAKVPRLVVDETTSTANPFVDGRICHSLTAATATATAAAAAATAAATAAAVEASVTFDGFSQSRVRPQVAVVIGRLEFRLRKWCETSTKSIRFGSRCC